ncbi:MAG TPA: histidinol dehydrogenase, partial [Beijerinckiaceae bacterium]|nr:histidinol dehydrogenase [Beijerinckiaceae bacterium]
MPLRLDARDPAFARAFEALLAAKREVSEDVDETVRGIITEVVRRGDDALLDYTRRFDGLALSPSTLRVSAAEVDEAVARCTPETLDALAFAKGRIEAFHRAQRPADALSTDGAGVTLGWRWTALESVGLYVPGGTASYPSSVLMNAVPAKVAGVPRVVMVAPTPRGETNPLVLAAARLAGVDEIYRIGGVHAIGAMAYGTTTLRAVDKIFGPGNAYTCEAMRQVFGVVGVNGLPGPSELMVIADETARADFAAADLLAQAEHGSGREKIYLVGTSPGIIAAIKAEVDAQLTLLTRSEKTQRVLHEGFVAIEVTTLAQAAEVANFVAPEHLELLVAEKAAQELTQQVTTAGAIM